MKKTNPHCFVGEWKANSWLNGDQVWLEWKEKEVCVGGVTMNWNQSESEKLKRIKTLKISRQKERGYNRMMMKEKEGRKWWEIKWNKRRKVSKINLIKEGEIKKRIKFKGRKIKLKKNIF